MEIDFVYRMWSKVENRFIECPVINWRDLDDKVLEHWTGRKDVFGGKIFVGDILCWHNCIGFVKFSDSLRAYVVQVVKKGKYIQTPLLNSVCYFAKIIGNIHENPELLGGEK